jgi:DNA-binding response OmpR family regulator
MQIAGISRLGGVNRFFTRGLRGDNRLRAPASEPDPSVEAATIPDSAIHAGVLEIRPDEFIVLADGQPVLLTVRELSLLCALADRRGRIVSRAELYAAVWDRPFRKEDRSVDVYVRKVRHKLECALPEWRFIHTHFGFGYRFAAESASGVEAGS